MGLGLGLDPNPNLDLERSPKSHARNFSFRSFFSSAETAPPWLFALRTYEAAQEGKRRVTSPGDMRWALALLVSVAAAAPPPASKSALVAPAAENDTEEWKKLMQLSPADLEEELKAEGIPVKVNEGQDTAVQDVAPSESPAPSSGAPQPDDGSWTGDLGLPAAGEFDDGQWHGDNGQWHPDQPSQRQQEQPPLPVIRASAPHGAQSKEAPPDSCVDVGAMCCRTATGMPFCAGAFVCGTDDHCAHPDEWEAEAPMDWVCNKPEKWCTITTQNTCAQTRNYQMI